MNNTNTETNQQVPNTNKLLRLVEAGALSVLNAKQRSTNAFEGAQQHQAIRAELPAQYIQQLPSIENLLLHLEGKGEAETP